MIGNALNEMLKQVQQDKKKPFIPNQFRDFEFRDDNKRIAIALDIREGDPRGAKCFKDNSNPYKASDLSGIGRRSFPMETECKRKG